MIVLGISHQAVDLVEVLLGALACGGIIIGISQNLLIKKGILLTLTFLASQNINAFFFTSDNGLTLPTFTGKSDEGEKRRGYEIRFEKGGHVTILNNKSNSN